ncbi:MAG TPA: thioredoxin family protein [Nitrospirota bacterium]|nr:thioredoxin family protein [Nitrospirota bacterium]
MKSKIVILSFLMLTLSAAFSTAGSLDDSLSKAKAEGKIVMLELGSVGCIPCEQMKPVMAKLSDSYKGKMEVIFIDVRKDHDTARRFGVFMIPVQVFLDRDGKEFYRHMGFYSYEEIAAMLKKTGI